LEAARQLGIYIPHYCYHPELSIVASCRLCLVEIEKTPKLMPACSTPLADGQVIHTQSEKARRARNLQMELLLVNHPLDCPICDQGGHCQLQRYSMDYGADDTRFRFPKRVFPKPDLGPFIDLERNRCILCTRCTRFLDEVAGDAELEVMSRGSDSYIGSFMERSLKGEFTGNIIDLCPVGSLTDKVFRFRARVWELKATPSVCPYCAVGCSVLLDTQQRTHQLLRITPRANMSVNGEWICDKGRFGFDYVNCKDRARTPLVKRNNTLARPDGTDVIDLIVGQWKAIRDQHGANALAGLISPRQSNETLYLFQRLFRNLIESNNIDHRLDHVFLDNDDAYLDSVRIGALNDPLREVRGASTIFLIGSDLPNELPILNLQVRQRLRKGAELLVAHRRGTRYNNLAEECCIYNPGTETAFLAGLFLALLHEKNVEVPQALRSTFDGFNCAAAAERCGVGLSTLEKLARSLMGTSSATILLGEEAWSAPDGIQIVRGLANIARLTGLRDDRRVGINLLLPHSNSRGASDMGVYPHLGPGLVPVKPEGKNTHCILRGAAEGEIKSLFIVGEDLLARYPDRDLAAEALSRAEFVVVADAFVHETARAADVFLPTATFCESEGTYTNLAGQVQRAGRALAPLPGSAPAWRLIQVLAQRLGADWNMVNPADVFAALTRDAMPYNGMTWDGLEDGGLATSPEQDGSIFALEGGRYLAFEISPAEIPREAGHYLQRGRLLFDRAGDASRTPALVQRSDPCEARLSPADAAELELSTGKPIAVESRGGRVTIPFTVDAGVPTGSVAVLGDFDDVGLNRLTSRGAYRVRISQEAS
jgi:NADH-quinone oxidoreductase subunit G